VLFSSDLSLAYDKLIDYYSLRFQIDFNFRDAKQFWGLEDFMNLQEQPIHNAANLSLFMVNLSKVLIAQLEQCQTNSSVLDLKARFRAEKYALETLKLLPQKPDAILIQQILTNIPKIGAIRAA
jgi:putative transposase